MPPTSDSAPAICCVWPPICLMYMVTVAVAGERTGERTTAACLKLVCFADLVLPCGLLGWLTRRGCILRCTHASDNPQLAQYQESYAAIFPHVLIRFGRWDEILSLQMPKDKELMATTYATLLYARALSHAAKGDITLADDERAEFEKARKAASIEGRLLHNNTVADMLALNSAMLFGEVEYRKGNLDTAFKFLRDAVKLDDALKCGTCTCTHP